MIVFALIALGWWLAAPDRFTAAARTATGTGLKAAGTGARAHWNGGRDGRKAVRTDRRDRWHAKGGWWRKLLGLEHGAVVTGKAMKGTGKLVGAAVKPVPAAVRDGWRLGQAWHGAKVGDRPIPLALDLPWHGRRVVITEPPADQPQDAAAPWWRKPVPAPVPPMTGQDSPQDSGTAREEDGWPAPDFSTGAIVNPMPYLHQPAAVSPAAAGETPIKVWKSSAECGGCGADADYTTDTACPNCGAGFTSIQSVYPEYADAIRRERPDLPVTTTVEGDPVFENEANHSQAAKMRRDQARHRSSASPGSSGATPTELRTHVAVQDFAKQVDSLSEASDFVVVAEQAREVGAKSRAGGFGAEMDSAVDELEAVAKRFAQDVDSLRAQAHHLAKTSLSVQGS